MFKGDDEVPEILNELPNPWSKGKGMDGVSFDNNQHNGKHGSPLGHGIGKKSEAQEMGVDWVMSQPDDKGDSKWEKSMGVFENVEAKFKDWDSHNAKEYDLKPHIDVVGMPIANDNHNTHCEY